MKPLGVLWVIHALISAAHAQSPVALPPAEWIWAADEPASRTAILKKAFTAKAGLQNAVLIGACSGRMSVSVNGKYVGNIGGRERGTSFEVSHLVRSGENEISLAASTEAQGAAAVILELVYDTSMYEWIVTDGSWLASPGASVEAKPVARLGRADAKPGANPFDPSRAVDA